MELRDLKAFMAVVEHRSFTKAHMIPLYLSLH